MKYLLQDLPTDASPPKKRKKKICKQLHENSDFDTSNSTSLNLGSQYFVTNAYASARLCQRRVAICIIKLICDRSRKGSV